MAQPVVAPERARRWLLAGPVIAFLVTAAVVVAVSPASGDVVGFLGMVGGLALAGAIVIRRSRGLPKRERDAWIVIAFGCLLLSSGVLVVGILTEAGVSLPAFGAQDVFFLGGYVALIIAMYRLARSEGDGRDWLPTILDALVGGIALATLVWIAFFEDLVGAFGSGEWWELAIAVTYPLLDVIAVVGLMILVIRRSHYHLDVRLVFLALGLTVQVIADFVYLNRGIGNTFLNVQPAWSLLMVSTALILGMAALVDRTPKKREFPEDQTPLWALVWPYLLAASLLVAYVGRYRALNPAPDEQLLLDAIILIGIVIFFRQVLVIHRSRVRVERQRSELVASVSHELRTPLTAMVGYLTLLDENGDEFPEDARREMIAEATGQARHMARLVSDLVILARGDHRHLPLELKTVSVSSIVTASLRNLETEDTRVEEVLPADAMVTVDADRVQQALTNMLSNAVRYGGDHALLVGQVNGSDLVLDVHDNGRGVPTRHETNIWQRFERGAHRLNAVTPGLGIGLAIVLAVAESHGGTATYRRSERLGGACFSLIIPGCVVPDREPAIKVDAGS